MGRSFVKLVFWYDNKVHQYILISECKPSKLADVKLGIFAFYWNLHILPEILSYNIKEESVTLQGHIDQKTAKGIKNHILTGD